MAECKIGKNKVRTSTKNVCSSDLRKQMLVVLQYADVAELADALDLGSSVYDVQVQLLSSAVLLRIDKHNKI